MVALLSLSLERATIINALIALDCIIQNVAQWFLCDT